jgi:hypothetical protein
MNLTETYPCHPARSTTAVQPSCAQYRQLKLNVRQSLIAKFQDAMPVVLIRRAVEEAEQVALGTDFPHLFLPELAEEQVNRISEAIGYRPLVSVSSRAVGAAA